MEFFLFIQAWSLDKFLGFVFFVIMALVGFWCLTFLITMLPFWLTFGAAENYGKLNADSNPDDIKRKTLAEQEGVEVIYRKK